MNYKITLAFDGASFSGWQFQKNARTVQGTITECASRFFGVPVTVTGCSRTDSKVHADNYVCNIVSPKAISPKGIVRGMNTVLPPEIAFKECEEAEDSFHARYDCKKKEYRYLIQNTEHRDPFLRDRVLHFPNTLDAEKMNEDAKKFIGTFDYSAFMAAGSKITDAVRTVYSAEVCEKNGIITFCVSANGFLYNMVRIMTGTLIDINLGRNKMDIKDIIETRDRRYAGFTAPPQGLYLHRVYY